MLGFIQGIFISIKETNQLLIRSPKASEVTFLFLFLRSEKKDFQDRMHNKKRQNSSGACVQTILELSSCRGGRSYAQSPYLRCMPIGTAHHQDEIIHLAQFPFPLFLYKLHILNTKRKGEANSTWWSFIISLTFEPLLPSPFTFFPKCVTDTNPYVVHSSTN